MTTEKELIQLAQNSTDDIVSKNAMHKLREKYDKSYHWCNDCDGLVCKKKDCCLNKTQHKT